MKRSRKNVRVVYINDIKEMKSLLFFVFFFSPVKLCGHKKIIYIRVQYKRSTIPSLMLSNCLKIHGISIKCLSGFFLNDTRMLNFSVNDISKFLSAVESFLLFENFKSSYCRTVTLLAKRCINYSATHVKI